MKTVNAVFLILLVLSAWAAVVYRLGTLGGERDAAIRLMQAADGDRLQIRRQLDRCRGIR